MPTFRVTVALLPLQSCNMNIYKLLPPIYNESCANLLALYSLVVCYKVYQLDATIVSLLVQNR